jgi:tRNA(Arg) A34 adenosine deaminase TadA
MYEQAMAEAIRLAKDGDYQIGAVVLDENDKIIGRGRNHIRFRHHLHHAEIEALIQAGRRGRTLVSTLQPCLMCQAAAMYSGITKIIYGENDSNINHWVFEGSKQGGVLYDMVTKLYIPDRLRSKYQVLPRVRGQNFVEDLDGVFVAGSYAKWCAGFGEYTDIDVFVRNIAHLEEVKTRGNFDIHVDIKEPYWDAESLIDTFPVSVQMAVLKGDSVIVRTELLEDEAQGLFRVMNKTLALDRSIQKYKDKGYGIYSQS